MSELIIPPDSTNREGVVIKFSDYTECRHNSLLVNSDLEQITCKLCGERLNPFFAIKKMMSMSERWRKQAAEADLAREALEKRTRTRCEKCGEMTKITFPKITLTKVYDRMQEKK